MTVLPPNTLPGLASYLLRPDVLESYRHSDLALTFHDEIKVAVEKARQAVDIPTRPETDVFVGPCIEPDCPGEITAHLPRDDEGEVTMRCDVSDRTWTAEQWRKVSEHIDRDAAVRPVWVSCEQAAETLNVAARTVRKWVVSGRLASEIRPRGTRRVRLVRQADVLKMRDRRGETKRRA